MEEIYLGLLIGTFISYLILIALCLIILKKINFKNKTLKVISYTLFLILIVLNPILIGYMHCLLTEFAAIPLLLLFTLIANIWIKTDKKYVKVITSILLVLSCVFVWFLKQPYIFVVFAPIVFASIISIFENKKIKNTLFRTSIIIISLISILMSNKLWNFILIKNNVDMETGEDTGTFIKTAILIGNTAFCIDFYEDHYEKEYINSTNLISEKDKQEINRILNNDSEYKSFKLINVFNYDSTKILSMIA